jgi:hypothetical protein
MPSSFRIAYVLPGQTGDALGVGLVELHRDAEGDRRHDAELVRRVDALDVEGRVCLGIAETLGFAEHLLETCAAIAHFRQDEIGRSVDDSGDPFDAVGSQPFPKRLDDRNPARHRRLEGHHDPFGLRRPEDLVAVLCQQRLVCRNDMLAVFDRRQHQLPGDAGAPDQLHDDVDFRVAHD